LADRELQVEGTLGLPSTLEEMEEKDGDVPT
jgi:hypothetical protein